MGQEAGHQPKLETQIWGFAGQVEGFMQLKVWVHRQGRPGHPTPFPSKRNSQYGILIYKQHASLSCPKPYQADTETERNWRSMRKARSPLRLLEPDEEPNWKGCSERPDSSDRHAAGFCCFKGGRSREKSKARHQHQSQGKLGWGVHHLLAH